MNTGNAEGTGSTSAHSESAYFEGESKGHSTTATTAAPPAAPPAEAEAEPVDGGSRPFPERAAPVDELVGWIRRFIVTHPQQSLQTVGSQVIIGARTVQFLFLDVLRGQFKWGEFVDQAAFMAATAFVPTMFVTIPIGVTLSIQFSLLAGQVGASSLAGAATGVAIIRQGAPLVASMLLATAVGSAISADLGSRTMREEVDAMEVMGVSAIRRLVVPRFAAAITVGLALTGWTCFIGYLAGYAYNVYLQDGTPGSFVATFASFATVSDLVTALIKSMIFGAVVAVVSCSKGLDTRGGPAGVANSVNAAVVESVLLLMVVNVVLSQLYVTIVPRETL